MLLQLPLAIAIAAASIAASASTALADGLATTETVKLRAAPRPAARVVGRLDAGIGVEIVARKGEWLQVRAGGRIGGAPGAAVTWVEPEPRAAEDTAPRRRWSQRRLPGDQLTVDVIADRARVFTRPSATSAVAFRVERGDELIVTGNRAGDDTRWLLIESPERGAGWIAVAAVAPHGGVSMPAGAMRTRTQRASAGSDRGGPEEPPSPPPRARLRGELGVTSMAMDYSSDGDAALANYAIDTSALTLGARVDIPCTPAASRWLLAVEVGYRFSVSDPGIHYRTASGEAGDVPFSIHRADASARAGWRVSETVGVFARGGYEYAAVLVGDVDNIALLGSEHVHGPTAGVGVDVAQLTPRTALRVTTDVLFAGGRSQTTGLEDGARSEVRAAMAGATIAHHLGGGYALDAVYRYDWARTTWSGASNRQMDVTDARRVDTSHTVLLGIGRGF